MKTGLIIDPDLAEVLNLHIHLQDLHIRHENPAPPEFFTRLVEHKIEKVCLIERGISLKNNSDTSTLPAEQVISGLACDQIAFFDVTVDKSSNEEVRFTDMTIPYDPELRELMRSALSREGFKVEDICVAGVRRPDLLTRMEMRVLANLGADFAVQYLHRETCRARERCIGVVALILADTPWRSLAEGRNPWIRKLKNALKEGGFLPI